MPLFITPLISQFEIPIKSTLQNQKATKLHQKKHSSQRLYYWNYSCNTSQITTTKYQASKFSEATIQTKEESKEETVKVTLCAKKAIYTKNERLLGRFYLQQSTRSDTILSPECQWIVLSQWWNYFCRYVQHNSRISTRCLHDVPKKPRMEI